MIKFIRRHFDRWLDKRIPAADHVTLNQKRIFIFPSLHGAFFLLVVAVLLIVAINYENNLAYLLVFLLLSLFNTAILVTYQNVAGLMLQAGKSKPAFAGDAAEFEVELRRAKTATVTQRSHHRINIGWPGNPQQCVDVTQRDERQVKLYCRSTERGLFKPGRILIESYYPLGFLRCWSWIDLDMQCTIYPKPVVLQHLPQTDVAGDGEKESRSGGQDDFWGFKDYNIGDSPKQIDWRGYAKGQPLQSKVYLAKSDEQYWVDWFALQSPYTELRLSQLCDWVMQLHRKHLIYGLRLPNSVIEPNSGDVHYHRVLTALALYGGGDAGGL